MLIDTRIIHRQGQFDVLAHEHTVTWPDGSRVVLHPVYTEGVDDMFLRALRHDELRWYVIDLRSVGGKHFEAEMKSLPKIDSEGLTYYALRLGYRNASEFAAVARAHAKASWYAGEQNTPAAFAYFGGRNQVAHVVRERRHAAA
jgi:hypothetical protein